MHEQQYKASIRTCQIIASALLAGVVMFAGVAIVIQAAKDPDPAAVPDDLPILLIIACVFTVMELVMRQVLLFVFDKTLKEQIEDFNVETSSSEEFLGLYQMRLIVTMGLLEGGAFFGLIVYLIEGHWGGLAIAGFLLMLMAFSFPTKTKFRAWILKHSGQSAYAGDESL